LGGWIQEMDEKMRGGREEGRESVDEMDKSSTLVG